MNLPCTAVLTVCLAASPAGVERETDDFGRVVYRAPSPVPAGLDEDLLPASAEELAEELRKLPRTWTVSSEIPFSDLIREGSLRYGVDAGIVEAVMATESAFNPFAVSRAGAIGLMQLMPATAERYGVSDIFDPRENVLAGTRYLSYLLSLFDGDLDLALAGYNAGENAVLRHGGIPPYRETQTYVRKVRRYLERLHAADRSTDSDSPREEAAAATRPDWLLRPSQPAAAIYHFVDERGVIHFTNVKPSEEVGKVHVWNPGR